MTAIKEITVFSIGDANELSTWSNVPYFFTKNLEFKNIKVNRVNLEENKTLRLIYKFSFFAFLKLLNKNSNHTYFRSGLNYFLTNCKIKKAIKEFNQSEILIFLTYSFCANKYHNKKVVLFGDWCYLYYISKFLKREPMWFEKNALAREKKHINYADNVINLFPKSQEFNVKHFNSKNQFYLGHVINKNYDLNHEEIISKKLNSRKLLFIGNKKYMVGALNLIKSFEKLNTNAELHIIGLTKQDVGIHLPGLFYYGYLNKGIVLENELYYKLIIEARVIVNTNPNWGSFSAITEAMYYQTPVITLPYPEFTKTYGTEINFGFYVNEDVTDDLTSKLTDILNDSKDEQINKMKSAHNQVKNFSWSAYTNKVINLINE